eukprot:4203163-Pyramimonas_sp.AAC.1
MAARKPSAYVSSIVVFNTTNDVGEYVTLSLVKGGAYEVSVGRNKTAFVRVFGFSPDTKMVRVAWYYTKGDALAVVVDPPSRSHI